MAVQPPTADLSFEAGPEDAHDRSLPPDCADLGALDIPIANDRGGRIGEDLDVVALDHHGGATKEENQARKPAS